VDRTEWTTLLPAAHVRFLFGLLLLWCRGRNSLAAIKEGHASAFKWDRARVNSAHFKRPRPESGLGSRYTYLKSFKLYPSRSRAEGHSSAFRYGGEGNRQIVEEKFATGIIYLSQKSRFDNRSVKCWHQLSIFVANFAVKRKGNLT